MKLFIRFINTIYWLWLFIVPIIPAAIISIWLYDRSSRNIVYIVIIAVISVSLGILLAESVRKKKGLITFFSTIISTPDINDRNVDENGSSEQNK